MCKLRCFKIFLTGKSLSAYLQLITLILNSFQSKQRLLFFFSFFSLNYALFGFLWTGKHSLVLQLIWLIIAASYSKQRFCFLPAFFLFLASFLHKLVFVCFILILIFFILFFVLKLHRALNIFALASSLIKLL